ncbi:hypothetical protein [Pseudomonas fluorescens]|uniref:hypothetical protein n=1 Tax=Pseudomonas fluorescens TaxID=294 RepID=UPI001FD6DBF7|nr:hypothetical protein [Pseudomonas fluorescens]
MTLPTFESLAEAIIGKQTHNLRYALEMSRQGDVEIHALVDKALDIRAMINASLLKQKPMGTGARNRPSTGPAAVQFHG